MEIPLEKIDQVRERAGVTYREAKEALENSGGDVVEALIYLEERNAGWRERISITGAELLDKLKEVLQQGNATRIIVKKEGETVLEIPVTIGAIGAILAPYLAVLGAVATLATRSTIEIERKPMGEKKKDETETQPEGPGIVDK